MSALSFIVRVCIWVPCVNKLDALGTLIGSLEFCSMYCECYYGLIFVCLVQLLKKNCSVTFSLESESGVYM